MPHHCRMNDITFAIIMSGGMSDLLQGKGTGVTSFGRKEEEGTTFLEAASTLSQSGDRKIFPRKHYRGLLWYISSTPPGTRDGLGEREQEGRERGRTEGGR